MAVSCAAFVVLLVAVFGVVDGQKSELEKCDIYDGKWVYDASYPLYDTSMCGFLMEQFTCQKNGRPDELYRKFRWKPHGCDLPRFNAKEFLKRYENKRIMFVGDSISLNQWQSLACILHSQIPHSAYLLQRLGGVSTLTFLKQNVSLILSRNALLVHMAHDSIWKVLKLNSISEDDAKAWQSSDVLVFNSWHWWLHRGHETPWDFITDGDDLQKDMDRMVAYEKALSTWAKWVHENLDVTKTEVFFQGISPAHNDPKLWGNNDGDHCRDETRPIFGPPYPRRKLPGEVIVEKVIGSMSKRVHLLNITRLSRQRKDGHPSVYGQSGSHSDLTMDCSHWCLPGVPDTWNELLFAELSRS